MPESENTLYKSHPSMIRNKPIRFAITIGLIVVPFVLPPDLIPEKHAWTPWIVMFFALFSLLNWYFACKGTTLTVTDKRATLRHGILSKKTTEVWHTDVRNVQLSQSILQRIFAVGAVGVSSAGQGGMEIEVSGMPSPGKIKKIIDEHRGR